MKRIQEVRLANAVREFKWHVESDDAYTADGQAAIAKYATDVAVALHQLEQSKKEPA